MKFEPWTVAYEKLNSRLDKLYPKFQELHIQLKQGGTLIAFKAYVAFMVLMSIVAFAVAFPLAFVILPFLTRAPFLSGINFLFSLTAAAATSMVTMLILYLYPGLKASNRKGPISQNLPYIANFLTLLSSSNVPPSVIFESVANIETLKEARLEFNNIIRDIEIFGNDLLSSILENAKLTPSDQLRELLIGYVATVRTGGNPTQYLKVTSEKITQERMTKLDSMLESLSAMAEIYIMLLVAAPLLFAVLFVTLGMIGSGNVFGMSIGTLLYLMVYAGIPVLGGTLIVIMSSFEK